MVRKQKPKCSITCYVSVSWPSSGHFTCFLLSCSFSVQSYHKLNSLAKPELSAPALLPLWVVYCITTADLISHVDPVKCQIKTQILLFLEVVVDWQDKCDVSAQTLVEFRGKRWTQGLILNAEVEPGVLQSQPNNNWSLQPSSSVRMWWHHAQHTLLWQLVKSGKTELRLLGDLSIVSGSCKRKKEK